MTIRSVVLMIALLGLVVGCASVKELRVKEPLAPMPQIDFKVGYKETGLRNGREVVSTVVAEDASSRSWSQSDGCSATVLKAGFAPVLKWTNCYGETGTQTVTLTGQIWPLIVGKMWSYQYSGTNGRDTWSGTRSCEVTGPVRIATALGEQDTFKVVCHQKDDIYVYYVAPALKNTVRSETHRMRGASVTYEVTRIE